MKHVLLKKFFLSLLGILLLLFATTLIADAHASLIKADPSPNALVPTAPKQLTLWFDEPIDLSFTTVDVYDQARARFNLGTISVTPGDPKQVRVPLKELLDGTYTVAWKVLSAADGHVTRGNYAFSVGQVTASVATTLESAPSENAPLSVFTRWTELAAILALVGAIFFRETVLTRSLVAVGVDETIADARWMQIVTLSLAVALASELARLALQASFATDTITVQSISQILFETRLGTLWIWRFTLLAMLGFLLFRVKPQLATLLSASGLAVLTLLYFGLGNNPSFDSLSKIADALIKSWNAGGALHHAIVLGSPFLVFFVIAAFRDEKTRRFVIAVLSFGTLATVSLSGHSSVQGDLSFPVIADWLHLSAVSFWVGGLFTLVWVVSAVWRRLPSDQQRPVLATLIPNFSLVALVSVAVILITGLYAAFLQIPSLDALVQTIYGESLTIKVMLFLVMLPLGAFHLLVTGKRFLAARDRSAAQLFRNFRTLIAIEASIGAIVIALAGFMTLSPPPRAAILATEYARQQNPAGSSGLVFFARPAPDLNVSLLSNINTNPQTFDAVVTGADKQPAQNVLRVIYEYTLLDQDVGITRVNVDNGSQGHYLASGSYLTIPGIWRVRVIVRRKGVDDIAATFPIYREDPNPSTTDPSATALLKQADAQMNALKALRATEELNDGENGVVVTRLDFQAPDRVHTVVEGGNETIALGTKQYFRESSGWTSLTRPEPYVFPSFNNAGLASSVRLGREELVDNKPTQIVQVDFTSSAGNVHFAYWVGEDDQLIHQYAMVAPSHYMVEHYSDFNAAIQIDAPANVAPPVVPPPLPSTNAPVTASPRTPGPITGDFESDSALGILIVALGIALRATDKGRARSSRLIAIGIAIALALAALFLFNDAINAAQKQFVSVPIDTAQAASGKVLYEQNCLVCHGETGYGNGPAAAGLRTKPYDLTVHAFQHDESYFISLISSGRGEMPAFRGKLTTADMLNLIQYMRQLARDAQATQ